MCILMGNLGRDPEIRHLPSGEKVASFSLATSHKWKDKNSGEPREETQWHRISAFGHTAEIVERYCRSGSPLHVVGSISYRKFTDKNGVEKTSTEIRADRITLLGTGRRESDPLPTDRPSNPAPERPSAAPRAPSGGATGFDDFDDDIPF
jgi:single-strand DNA-binding protein